MAAQEVPADYQQVLKIVGKSGDYKANVLKVNIPRNDLHMKVAGVLGRATRFLHACSWSWRGGRSGERDQAGT
jgi:hypothetical protein